MEICGLKLTHSIVGLLLNFIGTFVLLLCPSPVPEYTLAGQGVIKWVSNISPYGPLIGFFQYYGFDIGLTFLLFGFALQLIDLIKHQRQKSQFKSGH